MDTQGARQSTHFLHINSSDVQVLSRQGKRLAKVILQSHEPSLAQVVQEIILRADKKPTDIDHLLRIYLALAEELGRDPDALPVSGSAVQPQSRKASTIQLLMTKLHESYITLTEPNRRRSLWNVSEQSSSRKAMERVLAYGETRRSAFILQALRGRAMALGLESLDDAAEEPVGTSLHKHLSCSAPGGVTDDTELIGEVVLVLAAGHFLAPSQSSGEAQIIFLEKTRSVFEERLRAPSCGFRQQYFLAHAVKALDNGGKPWSSAQLFGETTWVG